MMTIANATRRDLAKLLLGGALGGALAGLPGAGRAQGRKDVLVIGLDIGDTVTLDPAKQNNYSPPLTLAACYDTLVTLDPGEYTTPKPMLATAWARTPDGQGWRFTLRPDAKFSSGNPLTAEDVKWTFDRIVGTRDQTAFYIGNVSDVKVVDPHTVDILLKKPTEPILDILAAPGFGILDSKTVTAQGGRTDASDKATEWLNAHTAGTGAYTMTAWARNAQIQLARNPHSWRGQSPYARVVIRHIPDSAAQLLAVQRGDVDVAFNLIPEQINSLKGEKQVRVEKLESLDFVYLALTQEAELNKALAVKEARQAIAHAIDYDGIRTKLLGGEATRPASFLPVGVLGSTQADADRLAPKENLDLARQLLQKAGLADGFEFDLSYGQAVIAGISYGTIAQKLQSDLARVGIRAKLNPMDQVNMRTQYIGGKASAVITFWNPPAVNNYLWAGAATQRVAKRVHWTPSDEMLKLVGDATGEPDRTRQAELWVEFQKQLVDQANLVILFQPVYQVAVRDTVAKFPLTAAGWLADVNKARP
jgi:peptide/nickel transport system substrate-binding protein